MNDFARIVVGYHGCRQSFASEVLSGSLPRSRWPASDKKWDWLGRGIYFWEHDPERALQWATERYGGQADGPDVVGAIIQLGSCLDLSRVGHTRLLDVAHRFVSATYAGQGQPLPVNKPGSKGDSELQRRELDCLIVNECVRVLLPKIQTIRCPFTEGPEAYPGAMFRTKTHVQLAVRDPACILGVFRSTL